MVGWFSPLWIKLLSMWRTLEPAFVFQFWTSFGIFWTITDSVQPNLHRIPFGFSLVLLCCATCFWPFLEFSFFDPSSSFAPTLRLRICGSSAWGSVYLLLLVFLLPSMIGGSNFFLFFILCLRAFFPPKGNRGQARMRTVKLKPPTQKTSSNWRTWKSLSNGSCWRNRLFMMPDLVRRLP